MRTLDQVIKAFEICGYDTFCKKCPYAVNVAPHPYSHEDYRCSEGKDDDALHYLKELRDMTDIPMEYFENGGTLQKLHNTSQVSCPKCHSEFVILPEANNALTWSELIQMEGKPVWIEEYDAIDSTRGWRCCRWMLVEFINDSYMDARNSDGEQYNFDKGEETWQAYRKERS